MAEKKVIAKKEKAKKTPKPVLAKKLPSLLKKAYTKKRLEKKLLKKVYISDERKFLASFFKQDTNSKKEKFYIPKDTLIAKDDFRKLKLLAKEIKKQKTVINIVPLMALVIVFAVIGITVTLFKNTVIKYALTDGMQNIFQAKTDIKDVDLQIFKSYISISGIEQANKDEPMSNLFEIGNINVDFNLTELLRGKFDLENISVTEIAIGTKRKTSGELPVKAKKTTKTEKEVIKQINKKSSEKVNQVKDSLLNVFNDYNPETIISNVKNNLQTPELADSVQSQTENLVAKWKDKPEELQTQVNDLKNQIQVITNTDWSSISNPIELQKAIETIQNTLEKSKNLKETVQTSIDSIKSDTKLVKDLSSSLQKAIKNDKALVQKELDKITSFSMDTVKNLVSDSLTAIGYDIFGKYYPYVERGMEFANKMKAQSKNTSKVKAKKAIKTQKRMKGQDIYYKANTVPNFLIEKLAVSTVGFALEAKEISNDPDLRGKPADFAMNLALAKQKHSVAGTVDGRTTTKAPLINLDYAGNGMPLKASVDFLSVNADSKIKLNAKVDKNGNLNTEGIIDLSHLQLDSNSFEPEFAYNLYKKALSSIKTMKLDIKASCTEDRDIDIGIKTDADEQLLKALKNLASSELESIKSSAQKQIMEVLSEKTSGATDNISKYLEIDSLINGQGSILDNLNRQLASKKDEISSQLKKQAGEQIKSKIGGSAGNLLNNLLQGR